MARIELTREAPVVEPADALIRAPAERVRRVLRDLENRPSWNKKKLLAKTLNHGLASLKVEAESRPPRSQA